MALQLFGKDIIFAFVEETDANGFFKETTDWGFTLNKDDHKASSQEARWGKAILVGPDCVEVQRGDLILVEPLMWTNNFEHDDVKLWKTDELKVMLVDSQNDPVEPESE